MICIRNANVVLENRILPKGVIVIAGDWIVAVGVENTIDVPADAQTIDAGGAYVGPGFVDIHVHGGGGSMFYNAPEKAAQHFLSHGETTVLATLYYDLPKKQFLAAIDRIRAAMQTESGASIGGFYMEGPYMNPKYGASADKNYWKGDIRAEDYKELVDRAGAFVKVWAIAPEREGIEPFLVYARQINPTVTFAVGHSEATPAQVRRLKQYGLTLQTHCMNATGQNSEWFGTRGCGPDEACMLDPDMYAEMICDSMGIHVHPDLQKLILKVKGIDKVVLISDSFVSTGTSPARLSNVTDLMFDSNGNLCGSCLTMDVICRNIMKHTGCNMVQAFLMASRNPAKAVGVDHEVGTIAPGKKANLIFTDEAFHIRSVMLNGTFRL